MKCFLFTRKGLVFCTVLFFGCGSISAETAAVPVPSLRDVSYGADSKQKVDVYLAESDVPTPVVAYIHGGGWTGGTKELKPGQKQTGIVLKLLEKGVSVVCVEYRRNGNGNGITLPTPVHDAARAIQFIRYKADEWNMDKTRLAAWGGSAGGATSLWLLFHDDLADPKSEDPIARESTRLSGAVSQNGQRMIDPKWIIEHIGRKGAEHSMICAAVGEKNLQGALKRYELHRERYAEFSALNHLTPDDPPYWGHYQGDPTVPAISSGHGIHHRVFGNRMKEKSDAIRHTGHLSSDLDSPYKNELQFFEAVLLSSKEK